MTVPTSAFDHTLVLRHPEPRQAGFSASYQNEPSSLPVRIRPAEVSHVASMVRQSRATLRPWTVLCLVLTPPVSADIYCRSGFN